MNSQPIVVDDYEQERQEPDRDALYGATTKISLNFLKILLIIEQYKGKQREKMCTT
jgi:hypothetical protein